MQQIKSGHVTNIQCLRVHDDLFRILFGENDLLPISKHVNIQLLNLFTVFVGLKNRKCVI